MSETTGDTNWMEGANRAVETIAAQELPPRVPPPSKEAKKMMELMNETLYALHRKALDDALKAAQSSGPPFSIPRPKK